MKSFSTVFRYLSSGSFQVFISKVNITKRIIKTNLTSYKIVKNKISYPILVRSSRIRYFAFALSDNHMKPKRNVLRSRLQCVVLAGTSVFLVAKWLPSNNLGNVSKEVWASILGLVFNWFNHTYQSCSAIRLNKSKQLPRVPRPLGCRPPLPLPRDWCPL